MGPSEVGNGYIYIIQTYGSSLHRKIRIQKKRKNLSQHQKKKKRKIGCQPHSAEQSKKNEIVHVRVVFIYNFFNYNFVNHILFINSILYHIASYISFLLKKIHAQLSYVPRGEVHTLFPPTSDCQPISGTQIRRWGQARGVGRLSLFFTISFVCSFSVIFLFLIFW